MEKHRILLVEDEMSLGHIIRERIENKGYDVNWVMDGERALLEFTNFRPDLCLFDVMVPKKDGFTIAKEVKKIDERIPIIFLTAKSMPESVTKGFKLGADDYVTKPFRMEELLYRINAVIKRTSSQQVFQKKQNNYSIGIYTLDISRQILSSQKTDKLLSYKETVLLELLYLHKNDVLTRDLALKQIWGQNTFSNSRSMDVYILKLRNYLRDDENIKIINVWGKGFKLVISE